MKRRDEAGIFPAIGAKREPSSMADLVERFVERGQAAQRAVDELGAGPVVEQRLELAQFSDAQLAKLFVTRLHRIAYRLMGQGPITLAPFERNAMASDLEMLAEEIEERLGR